MVDFGEPLWSSIVSQADTLNVPAQNSKIIGPCGDRENPSY
jgi:hypothetical protein